jgi:iron complex outermembrane receptor protein
MKTKITGLCLLMAIMVLPLWGQNSESDTLLQSELPDLTVRENRLQLPLDRLARNLQVITSQELKRLPVLYFTDALQYVPGIDIRQRGPFGVQTDISIRGGTFDQTLVLLNGVKMNDPQTGHHTSYLPANLLQIRQIEVLKGSAARIYGQNAFSGAINVHTYVPENRRIFLHGYGGDFGLNGSQLGISLPVGNYRQFLSLGHSRSAGYRYNTDFALYQGFYQGELSLGKNQLDIMTGLSDRRFGANGFYASPQFRDQYEEVVTGFAAISYRYNGRRLSLTPRVSWRANDDNYVFIRSNPSFFNNLHRTDVVSAELHGKLKVNNSGTLGMGLETRREMIRSSNLGQHQRQISGLFAEYRWERNGWHITPGLYANYYSDYGLQWFPGVDASVQLHRHWSLFATSGRSFRIPTYTDLFYVGPSNLGNPLLQPEAAWTHEAGLKYRSAAFSGQASAYYLDARQLIDWTRQNELAPWQPTNLNALQSMGLEMQAAYQPVAGHWTATWLDKVQIGYHSIRSDFRADEGLESRYALEHLRHQLLISLDHKIARGIRHSIRLRWVDRISMPAYMVLDNKLFWQRGETQVYLEISNLTNTLYRETNLVDMPGRWFRLGAQTSFGY